MTALAPVRVRTKRMPRPKLVMTFMLPEIADLATLEAICANGYNRTHWKWSVEFAGSKGYLNHVSFRAEGDQDHRVNTRIDLFRLREKDRSLKNVPVQLWHDDHRGIQVVVEGHTPPLVTQRMPPDDRTDEEKELGF